VRSPERISIDDLTKDTNLKLSGVQNVVSADSNRCGLAGLRNHQVFGLRFLFFQVFRTWRQGFTNLYDVQEVKLASDGGGSVPDVFYETDNEAVARFSSGTFSNDDRNLRKKERGPGSFSGAGVSNLSYKQKDRSSRKKGDDKSGYGVNFVSPIARIFGCLFLLGLFLLTACRAALWLLDHDGLIRWGVWGLLSLLSGAFLAGFFWVLPL
jgi:hypothetical protein